MSCARPLTRNIEKNYGYSLRKVFLPWASERGIVEADQLDQRLLDRFTVGLLDTDGPNGKLSRHTVHSYIRPVRQFLAWAHHEGDVLTAVRPQLPKLDRLAIDVLSRDDIDRLEAAAQTERGKLIIRLLADTGTSQLPMSNESTRPGGLNTKEYRRSVPSCEPPPPP